MKKSILKNIIKETISDMEVSLKLSNGKIIHGKARTNPKALSLQIGSNTYFYFWEGKFIKSGTGGKTAVTIVEGVDDRSYEWLLKATEKYLVAMHASYPKTFGPLQESEYKEVEKQMFDLKSSGKRDTPEYNKLIKRRAELEKTKMNKSTSRTVIIKSTEEWNDLVNELEGYKYSGSLKPVSVNKGYTQLHNYANTPYEVIIDDNNKIVKFGEHTLNENKMTKRDIIRIINEEVETALDEIVDPIYNSNLPEIVASLIASGVTIKQIIKFILEKYKNKKNGDKLDKDTIVEIIKKAKSKLNESSEATNWDEVLKRNLTDPSSDLFTFDFNGKRTTLRVTRVNKISFDNIKFLHIDVQLEPNNIVGDTQTIVVGKNAKEVFLPSKGNTGELELVGNSKSWLSAVRQSMLKQKSQQQDDTINEGEEVYNVIDRETEKLITDTPIRKSLALRLAALHNSSTHLRDKKKGWIIQKHKESVNEASFPTPQRGNKYSKKELRQMTATIPKNLKWKTWSGDQAWRNATNEYYRVKGDKDLMIKWLKDEIKDHRQEIKSGYFDAKTLDVEGHKEYIKGYTAFLTLLMGGWQGTLDFGESKESVNENEGMTKSLKDIDPSLSLTKYDTTPPSFKITYVRKEDMSKEMEEELVAWVLSKGGVVDEVNNKKEYTVEWWQYTKDDDYDRFDVDIEADSEEDAIYKAQKDNSNRGKDYKVIETHYPYYPYVKFSYK